MVRLTFLTSEKDDILVEFVKKGTNAKYSFDISRAS